MSLDWRHRAACRDIDPELFFPVGNTGPAIAQIEEAKKICVPCVVRQDCLQWALESGQDSGVWGGLSEDCLLYTSPSPRDRQKSRMPSSA